MAKGLTERQSQVLSTVAEFIDQHGYPPSVREIGWRMRISSTNGVADHLRALERKGFLRIDRSRPRARAITLTGKSREGVAGTERAAIVAYLRAFGLDEMASAIEAGAHHG